jgi:methylated-DNA-[protein]-cysteine S-methyltransferase
LQDYFDGQGARFDLPLAPRGTPFQRRVWEALRGIPAGETRSYAAIGQAVGCRAPRAIGQANGANPIPILIPCHRVVAADGSIGGYSGGEGQATKRYLLALEARAALPAAPLARAAPGLGRDGRGAAALSPCAASRDQPRAAAARSRGSSP